MVKTQHLNEVIELIPKIKVKILILKKMVEVKSKMTKKKVAKTYNLNEVNENIPKIQVNNLNFLKIMKLKSKMTKKVAKT